MESIDLLTMFRAALAPIIGLAAAVGLGTCTAAIAQLRVNNVNAIHELYSENELAAKINTTTNLPSFTVVLTGLTIAISSLRETVNSDDCSASSAVLTWTKFSASGKMIESPFKAHCASDHLCLACVFT